MPLGTHHRITGYYPLLWGPEIFFWYSTWPLSLSRIKRPVRRTWLAKPMSCVFVHTARDSAHWERVSGDWEVGIFILNSVLSIYLLSNNDKKSPCSLPLTYSVGGKDIHPSCTLGVLSILVLWHYSVYSLHVYFFLTGLWTYGEEGWGCVFSFMSMCF